MLFAFFFGIWNVVLEFLFQLQVHSLCMIMWLHFVYFLMSLWLQVVLCHHMGFQVHNQRAECKVHNNETNSWSVCALCSTNSICYDFY